jgi:hypothetical protein
VLSGTPVYRNNLQAAFTLKIVLIFFKTAGGITSALSVHPVVMVRIPRIMSLSGPPPHPPSPPLSLVPVYINFYLEWIWFKLFVCKILIQQLVLLQ